MIEHVRQVPLIGAAVVAGLVMALMALAFFWLGQGRLENCQAIEDLKAEFRSEAVEDYANLERNAALVGIEITPAIREAARKSRDATLRRFAATDC